MSKAPVFMRVAPAKFPMQARPVSGQKAVTAPPTARMTTTVAEGRVMRNSQPVVLTNPRLAMELTKIQPQVINTIGTAQEGDTRDKVTVPISPVGEPTDSLLFEDSVDAMKKYYLPRYRLREQGGRYEIGVVLAPDGLWRLTAGLEIFPAPELSGGVQGAAELPHDIAVFFRYGAGPSHTIEKTVDFKEVVKEDKRVTVSVGLSMGERDGLLFALQTPAAAPRLVVRRAITVAFKVATPDKQPNAPVLIRRSNTETLAVGQPKRMPAATPTIAQPAGVTVQPQMMRMAMRPLRPIDGPWWGGPGIPPIRPRPPIPPPDIPPVRPRPSVPLPVPPAPPVDRYRTIQRALDDVADPELFVLDPRLHPYLYEGASASGGASETKFSRITLSHPQGSSDARFHVYLQDKAEPWVFYYLPDRFKLSRREVAPFLPQMVVRIASPDGAIENASVTIDYVVEPWTDPTRLKTAPATLTSKVPAGARQTQPELWPLQARASLKLWVPDSDRPTLADQKDVDIDLANGFMHSLTLPLEGFHQLYAAAYSQESTSLFSGQVLVETGLSTPELIPLEIRFADTQGETLSFQETPSDSEGTIAVTMQNSIESPVRLSSLPVRVRKGTQEVASAIEGLAFNPPLELAAGAEVSFIVRPQAALPGDGVLDAIFDTSGATVLPDPEKILPLISDTSVPAEYEREIDVMTMPELLGDAADPASILLINVDFKGGGNLKLTREQPGGMAQVRLPLMDLLLGRDVQGKYGFRQQIIRRNGSQTLDPNWREADFSVLVLPIA